MAQQFINLLLTEAEISEIQEILVALDCWEASADPKIQRLAIIFQAGQNRKQERPRHFPID